MKYRFFPCMVTMSLLIFAANMTHADIDSRRWDRVELKIQERRIARTYVITDWQDFTHLTGCVAGDREYWDELVGAWYDGMTGKGAWVEMPDFSVCVSGHCDNDYGEGGQEINHLHGALFADQDIVDWGEDHLHLDKADAVMVGWHGFSFDNIYHGEMSYWDHFTPGAGSPCWLGRDEMALGDTDLEFLHFSSSHSMDWQQWPNWWNSFDGAHIITGFNGSMYVSIGQVDNYKSFANSGFRSTIADAWIDNFYLRGYRVEVDEGREIEVDQCPVVYAVGRNHDDMWSRVSTERYDLVHTDPRDVGYWGAIWIAGCNSDAGPMPDCILYLTADTIAESTTNNSHTENEQEILKDSEVKELLGKALEGIKWSEDLLKVPDGVDWTKDIDLKTIIGSLGDPDAEELKDEETIIIQRNLGKFDYINRARKWDYFEQMEYQAFNLSLEEDDAKDMVQTAIEKLGIPKEEIAQIQVATQVGDGVPVGQTDPINLLNQGECTTGSTLEMYRIVDVKRLVAQLPVYNSTITAAVNDKGVHRIKIRFPAFQLRRRLRLLQKDQVIEGLLKEITKRSPFSGMQVQAYLAYAPDNYVYTEKDDTIRYVPAIIATVYWPDDQGITPYQLIYPVADENRQWFLLPWRVH